MKTSTPSTTVPAPARRFRLPPRSLLIPTVALFAFTTTLPAAEPSSSPAAAPTASAGKIETPIISSDEAVKKSLVELDRLLDAPGSKLEELLRKNMDRIEEDAALKSMPELEVALKNQPGVLPALRTERQFLLNRYLARRARGPLLRPDVIALNKFLSENLDIRRALNRDPSQIVEGNFLMAHPNLAEFFGEHPSLSTVLLIPQQPAGRGGRRGGDTKGK